MMRNDTIKHLDMASNFSGNRGAFEWGNVLKRNTSLTRLSLTDNEISEQGGAVLLSALQHNKTVRFFGIGGQSVAPPYGNQLSLALRKAIRQQLAANNAAHPQPTPPTSAVPP